MFPKTINILRTKPAVRVLACVCGVMTLLAAGSGRTQQAEVVDRIVAVVNADIITLYDLNRAFKPYEENIKALKYEAEKERQTLFQVRKDILSQLIDGQLADQQIKREQIEVS